MKKISLLIVSFVTAISVQAQDYTDALRYSESMVEGDARYMAMGGALSSLGGNLSAMSVNPAGSAVYKKSVLEFSPTYLYTKSENYYLGYDRSFVSSLAIPSWGFVLYKALKQNDVFASGLSFGFSMNAQNHYDQNLTFSGINTSSSLTDDFVRLANTVGDPNNTGSTDNMDGSYERLAWETYLIDFDTVNNAYFSDFINQDGTSSYGEYQNIEYNRDGQKREYLFNFGVDFSEYVYFGADLSIINLYYTENKIFTEKDRAQTKPFLNNYTYSTQLDVNGNGVGGKFGVILRPIEYVRIGLAAHTPVMYSFSEDYETQLGAMYDQDINGTGTTSSRDSFTASYDYKIAQPAKFIGSLGFVYKNVLNVGVDLETMNYSQCSLQSDLVSMSDQNSQIESELTNVNNLKCGGEFRYGPFTFRAGYAMYGNPYKNVTGDNFYRNDISGGVGLATNAMYCDLSWLRAKSKQYTDLYSNFDGDLLQSHSTIKRDYVTFTVGLKF